MQSKAEIQISPEAEWLAPSLLFVTSYAEKIHLERKRIDELSSALKTTLSTLIDLNRHREFQEKLTIEISETDRQLKVRVLNHAAPLYFSSSACKTSIDQTCGLRFEEAKLSVKNLCIENLGRKGQSVSFQIPIGSYAGSEMKAEVQETFESKENPLVSIRNIEDGEESALSRLFVSVYGYQYINEYVYYPEKLQEMRKRGELKSLVAALPDGRLVGHVGLVRQSQAPVVYEAALGIVDPSVKIKGLFNILFSKTMEIVREIPMQYCVYDLVTNHDYSQRSVSRYGSFEMALFLGSQCPETQVSLSRLGIGNDPMRMDRYSMLFAIHPRTQNPFGEWLTLPSNLGEMFEFILKPLGIRWRPSSRFYPLHRGGQFETHRDEVQKSIRFDLVEPGRVVIEEIIADWYRSLRDGYQYAAIDMPLDFPGVGQAYDMLAKAGFFVAGFVPYHFSDRLAFRFQAIAPTKVSFEEIRLSSASAKQLLSVVRDDYERNCLL